MIKSRINDLFHSWLFICILLILFTLRIVREGSRGPPNLSSSLSIRQLLVFRFLLLSLSLFHSLYFVSQFYLKALVFFVRGHFHSRLGSFFAMAFDLYKYGSKCAFIRFRVVFSFLTFTIFPRRRGRKKTLSFLQNYSLAGRKESSTKRTNSSSFVVFFFIETKIKKPVDSI